MILLDFIAAIFLLLSAITAHQFYNRTWIYGIISCLAYTAIFFVHCLYADMVLQIIYIIASGIGYAAWDNDTPRDEIKTDFKPLMDLKEVKNVYFMYFEITVILIPIIGCLLSWTNDPLPYLDAALFTFSIIATIMLTVKDQNSWILWMLVNFVYAYVFYDRGLYTSSIIYLVLLFNAAYGYDLWRKVQKA